MSRVGSARARAKWWGWQRAVGGALCVWSLVAGCGCATVDKSRAPQPATTSTATSGETAYPTWTRVTGWLLTPFTGASASVGF